MTTPTIQASYKCDPSLLARAAIESTGYYTHLYGNFIYYMWRFGLCTLAIFLFSAQNEQVLDLPIYYIIIPIACSVIFSLVARKEWEDSVLNQNSDYSLFVEADENGVQACYESSITIYKWEDYDWYMEEAKAIKIKHSNGMISFIPKIPETAEIIELTKSKIISHGQKI